MFAGRTHSALIELAPNEERLYRLPPMSNGPVFVNAFDAYITNGPHGEVISHNSPTGDLELELRHSNHLSLSGTNRFITESQWHDDLWRLRVRRPRRTVDPAAPATPLQYRIEAIYTSQLPVLERRIQAGFFHEGFEANYNRQQYLKVRLVAQRIELSFSEDFRQLYDLQPTYDIDVSPVSFVNDVA